MTTFLYKEGIRKHDIIITLFNSELLEAIFMFAISRIGATIFPVPIDISEVSLLENIKKTNALFTISDILNINTPFINSIKIKEGILFFNSDVNYSIYCTNPKSPWLIILGSGSTGEKKLIPISHKIQDTSIKLYNKSRPKPESQDRISSFIRLLFPDGKSRLLQSLYAGATYIILPNTILDSPIKILKDLEVSILFANTFYIEKVLQSLPKNSNKVLDSVKISLGTAPVSINLRSRIKTLLTEKLTVRYGTNECNPISSTLYDNVYLTEGTVGKSLEGVKIEIVNNKVNKKNTKDTGLIRIKSSCIFEGYIGNEQATNQTIKDGWFYPGDIGKLTEDGELIHMGRADDMMIFNGMNIYPLEIEQVILFHPDVSDVKVFPLKSKVHYDIPICVVSLIEDSKINEKMLLEYVSKKLGNNNLKKVFILDTIPRSEVGKIMKKELLKKLI